jgi:hypothetical protein
MSIGLLARQLPRTGWSAASQRLQANRLRIRVIWTLGFLKMSTQCEVNHIAGAENKSGHPDKRMNI